VSRHAATRAPRRRATGSHRGSATKRVVPNYARLWFAGFAFLITLFSLLAGIGLIPVQQRSPAAAGAGGPLSFKAAPDGSSADGSSAGMAPQRSQVRKPTDLPARSGAGRRIVFDLSGQRVWLVDRGGDVRSTYLVSGSLTDNLHPGSYKVYSRSRWAVGIDDSGVMQYFVRFTRGQNAAIGFHSIPTKNGHALQTRADLGTPQSHGCIRQALPDAIRLWNFAPVGTKVVVTA
jgi:hypothetical protein